MAQDPFGQFAVGATASAAAPKPATASDPFSEFSAGDAAPAEESGSGIAPWLMGAAGVLGAGAVGALIHNPSLATKGVQGLNELRRALMLSGLALPKSISGAIGGSALASVERGSMAPIKEMLSMQTAKDAVTAFKAGGGQAASAYNGTTNVLPEIFHLPGRLLGAGDTAAQQAFQRAGFTAKEAAREMLQAPLGGSTLMNSLKDNPVADYLLPFRRTPINQFLEGFESVKPANLQTMGQKVALGTTLAAGGITGAEADDPKTIALGTAMSGRRGVPFAAAAGVGRLLATGSKRKAADAMQGISPVSDYSLSEGVLGPVQSPTSILPKPAALGASKYIGSFFGVDPFAEFESK